jgi:hypothetical protein
MVGGDENIGKRLVVAQQHVEAWPQPLDQVGFQQQRFGLGDGRDEFDRMGQRDHALDAGVVPGRTRVGDDPLPDVLRLADIKHLAGGIEHPIDPGRRRREPGVTHQRGAARRQWRLALDIEGRLVRFGQRLVLVFFDEFAGRIDILVSAAHAAFGKSSANARCNDSLGLSAWQFLVLHQRLI